MKKLRTLRSLALLLSVAGFAQSATAGNSQGCPAPVNRCDAGCYDLTNKVTGVVAPPNYGLRLDGLFGNPSDNYTFDFEAPETGVEMCYDGAGLLTVDGIAYGGLDIGGQWDPGVQSFVEIHFVWQNAACVGNDLLVQESNGGYGYGTVEWLSTGEVFYLQGKANAAGDVFLFDQSNGDEARGWVTWNNGLVGDFAMRVTPTNDCPPGPDCDGDGIDDSAEADCNANGVPDDCEVITDCDANGIPDECDITAGAPDLDQNGVPDVCEPGIEVFCTGELQQTGQGQGPCPCGNNVVPGAQEGCLNSSGSGASLSATGSPSISAADLVLVVGGTPSSVPGVFFSGTQQTGNGVGAPFYNGLRCVGGNLFRIKKVPFTPGGQITLPSAGLPPLHVLVGAQPGDTDYFQFWYRDPGGPCGSAANMTNGLRVTWGS